MNIEQVVITGRGPGAIELRKAERPAPRRGRVVVEVEAAGISYAEVQMMNGLHPFQPRTPFVPGYDLVGRIADTGQDVHGFSAGDRVAAMPRKGAWAQYVELPASALMPVPAGVDAGEAVALVTNGVTAWQLVHRRAGVCDGDTVLVHGAAGGCGTLLTTFAVASGATVIGTASAPKHETVRALGGHPIDYRSCDVSASVRELAPAGVNAVFDHIGRQSLDAGWSLLAPGGTLVSYDSAVSGYKPGQWLRPHLPTIRRVLGWKLRGSAGLTGGRKACLYYVKPDEKFRADLALLFDRLKSGKLRPAIAGRYPLAEAPAALRELAGGRVAGKLVLIP